MNTPLKDFSSIIVNHHRFVHRGSKSKYFTPGKKYEIKDVINSGYSLHTIDDEGHTHTLGINYFNQHCTLIDVPCEILEKFDDLEDALINKDPKEFSKLALDIIADLRDLVLIKEKDVNEGDYFESTGQIVKAVVFDGKWILVRKPKLVSECYMIETYETKSDLVKKLINKEYKKIS